MLTPDIATAKAQKQSNIFSIFAVNTNFSQGAVQERPRFDIRFVTFTDYHFGTIGL
jgi:hypothetical protein